MTLSYFNCLKVQELIWRPSKIKKVKKLRNIDKYFLSYKN